MLASSEKQQAIEYDPDGVTCGHCGGDNNFYDDCGWFYFCDARGVPIGYDNIKDVPMIAGCEACYRGPIGKSHTDRFGVGER